MEEIIKEVGVVKVTPSRQYKSRSTNNSSDTKTYELSFQKLHVYHRPTFREKDRLVHHPSPQDARLRNLTYEVDLYIDVLFRIYEQQADGTQVEFQRQLLEKKPFGRMPVMVRSNYCMLSEISDEELVNHNECFYDQGGYFIVKGGEKAVVA